MKKSNTAQQCQEIILKIIDICNSSTYNPVERPQVGFEKDFGGFSLTVTTPMTHYHVGAHNPEMPFSQFVEELHRILTGEE